MSTETYLSLLFIYVIKLTAVACTSLSTTDLILPKGRIGLEDMTDNIEHFSLSEIRDTIALNEGNVLWLDLTRTLQKKALERTRSLSRLSISIPIPDPYSFRALAFEINPVHRGLIFEFHSIRGIGPTFNITIGSDLNSLQRDFGFAIKRRENRMWIPSMKIQGTMILMVHPKGIGIQIFFVQREIVTTKYESDDSLPWNGIMEIIGYQQHSNRSVIRDMCCMSLREFIVRFPNLKSRWTDIQANITGKSKLSMYCDRGYRLDSRNMWGIHKIGAYQNVWKGTDLNQLIR